MYRISYEKCVCFIFLVILVILSCSGFRIDNLAMTDISKRNFHTSSSFSNSDESFDRIFNVRSSPSVETITPAYRHKIRHHRQLRAQAHNSHRRFDTQKPPTGHIDVEVFPPRGYGLPPTTLPSEQFAQIPSTDIHHLPLPTRPVVTRSQRSSDQRRHQKTDVKWQTSQEEDISMRAFRAEIVVLAQAESGSRDLYIFKANTTYKNTKQFPIADRISLKIASDRADKSQKSRNLVKHRIHLGKSYILFLNASNAHSFWSVGPPKMIRPVKREKIDTVINRVCNAKFVPTRPAIVELREVVSRKKTEKRKLLCKVRGFPIPTISWRRKGQILHQSQFVQIQYKSDGTDGKRSRLIIKKMDANSYGQYECIAEGANGQSTSKPFQVTEPSQTLSESFSSDLKECDAPLRTSYCRNGGTCRKIDTMGEAYCICAPGYSGNQCDIKEPSLSRLAVFSQMF